MERDGNRIRECHTRRVETEMVWGVLGLIPLLTVTRPSSALPDPVPAIS